MTTVSPKQDAPISHYIAKFHLKNWAHPRGIVTYFNFATGTFETGRVARMYVSPHPFPEAIEDWLDRTIEQPLGEYVARIKRGPDEKLPPEKAREQLEPRAREWKAITLALLLQAGRTALARDPTDTTLADAIPAADELVAGSAATSQHFVAFTLSAGSRLCFPEAGIIGLPMIGGMGFFLPVHPRVYVALVPRGVLGEEIQRTFAIDSFACSLSVGLTGDRVVVPPMRSAADHKAVAEVLRTYRSSAQQMTQLFLQMNEKIGVTLANNFAPPKGGPHAR